MFSALRAVPATRSLARSFSTSPIAKADVSKLTLIGRLGTDPVERETGAGKKYLTYVVATQPAATKQEDGTYRDGDTSWHTVFNFSEPSHNYVKSAGKGSVVYVEAELEYRKSEPIGEQRVPDRVLLRQQTFRVINRVKPEGSETSE